MLYRALDQAGDMQFGRGSSGFLANSPATVAQAVDTRMRLWLGQWFLDVTDGTPWQTEVLGPHTEKSRDLVIQERILGTQGVLEILAYSSNYDFATRKFTANIKLQTIYGQTQEFGINQ